jgi:hypothetical protein
VNEDALHVDLEHPVARPAGLALLAALAVVGFAQGLLPKLWSDLSVDQPAPLPSQELVARPLIEDPTPPVLAIAPKAPAAPRPTSKPPAEVAAVSPDAAAQSSAATAAGQDAATLAAPPPLEAPPREPAEIGEPVPAELPPGEPAHAEPPATEAAPPP